MEHLIDPRLLQQRVHIHLVGVGGNGAQMAARLARLDIAMRALGHPAGLRVTAWDPDEVSESNVGRQLYSPSDVGHNKAVLTVHRLNLFYGLDWAAVPARYEPNTWLDDATLVVSCVDSRSARRALHDSTRGVCYWLDMGNTESTAQVVLGQPEGRYWDETKYGPRLPVVTDLYPEIVDPSIADDNTPSCSVRMSLVSQGLFVNDAVVTFACQLLYRLFSQGRLSVHGAVINLDTLRTAPIEVRPEVWKRFGYPASEVPRTKRRGAGGRRPGKAPAATA
jgi:PRTRC genetic system ThiF family protein